MNEIFINDIGWVNVPERLSPDYIVTGKWTEYEDKILRSCYPAYGVSITARILQRFNSGVSGRATFLGIKGPPRNGARPNPRPDTLGRVA